MRVVDGATQTGDMIGIIFFKLSALMLNKGALYHEIMFDNAVAGKIKITTRFVKQGQ